MVNSKDIPEYLKENAHFCNWKYETRDGRLTKVPYNPHTNNKASVNNANTFTDFNSVVNALDIYDGIGIRVAGKIIAIDLDHCIKNGKLCSWSEKIVSHFSNTYIEISPSGAGLRIILLAPNNYSYDKDKYYIKKNNVEVYVAGATNRFVTITGNVLQKEDITENMDGFHWLLETYMKRENPKVSVIQQNRESYLTDESVIEKALLYMIQQVTAFARDYEDEFVELVAKNKNKELERRIRESKKELEQSMSRVSKIDLLIQRLYEDNVEGKISDKQFKKMTFAYENEQKTLNVRITELNKIIKNEQEKITNTTSFLNLIKCYTNITKLDAEIIRTFIEKVYIYNADTIGTKKIKKIKIVFNFIGEIDLSTENKQ